jgi:predicted RNA polymerase sigma factor
VTGNTATKEPAWKEYERALALATNDAERRHLTARHRACLHAQEEAG